MKPSDRDFEKKLLGMKLQHQDLISKEEEETAWKEILLEINKNEQQQPLKWWLAAASVVLIASLVYWLLPGKTTTYVTGAEERLNIALADGSEVTLNHSGQLQIDDAFGEGRRSVSLEGEAFFNIKKNPEQPFVIMMNDRQVKVLGTSFIVNHRQGATIVAVRSGRVQLSSRTDSIYLEAKQKGFISAKGELSRQTWDVNDLAWYTGVLSFENKSMSEVAKILSRHTKKPVEVAAELSNCTLTAKIEYERTEEVLDIIAETLEINWKEEPKRILFYGKGC